jgi:hypothetical protein
MRLLSDGLSAQVIVCRLASTDCGIARTAGTRRLPSQALSSPLTSIATSAGLKTSSPAVIVEICPLISISSALAVERSCTSNCAPPALHPVRKACCASPVVIVRLMFFPRFYRFVFSSRYQLCKLRHRLARKILRKMQNYLFAKKWGKYLKFLHVGLRLSADGTVGKDFERCSFGVFCAVLQTKTMEIVYSFEMASVKVLHTLSAAGRQTGVRNGNRSIR